MDFDLMSTDLQHDLQALALSFSSNSAGEIVILVTDDVWQHLMDQHHADHYFDDTDQGQPWVQHIEDQQP